MAGDFIKIDPLLNGAKFAAPLQNFIRSLQSTYQAGKTLRASLNHTHDGVDFTTLETMCGLEAGKGQVVFDLINGAIGSMEGAFQTNDAQELTERVG